MAVPILIRSNLNLKLFINNKEESVQSEICVGRKIVSTIKLIFNNYFTLFMKIEREATNKSAERERPFSGCNYKM